MNKLSKEEGMKWLPFVWTLVLSSKHDFFVEPFTLRELRYRCFFKKTKSNLVIYFHLSEAEELQGLAPEFQSLSTLPRNIYFYGAFNQITVCQMRSAGLVRAMTPKERGRFVQLVAERFDGKDIGDELSITPTPEDKQKALRSLQTGQFYCFKPRSYAYSLYERG